MSSTAVARFFLALNAAFSSLCGIALLIAPGTASRMMLAAPPGWSSPLLIALGGGLLMFAVSLAVLVADKYVSRMAVLTIVALDAGWVAGSGALLTFTGDAFSGTGTLAVISVAAAVAFFAVGQAVGAFRIVPPLSRAEVGLDPAGIRASVHRVVDAPAAVVWRVMNDHPGYAAVAANLSKVEVLEGTGEGMVRRCAGPKGESWTEVCDLHKEGKEFGFQVRTEAEDYPNPFSALQGRWGLTERGARTEFFIHIKARPKGGWLARQMVLLATKSSFKTVLIELADGWASRMEREAKETGKLQAAE